MLMDNGRDLAEMLCTAYESDASVDDPNEHYDFSECPEGCACNLAHMLCCGRTAYQHTLHSMAGLSTSQTACGVHIAWTSLESRVCV